MKKIIQFFKDSFAELKKVQWPSREEVASNTKVVLVSVFIFAVVLASWTSCCCRALNWSSNHGSKG